MNMKKIAILAVVVCVAWGLPAHARDRVSTRTRLEKLAQAGRVLLDAKMYKDALKMFTQAYSQFKPPALVLPRVLRDMGVCYEQMGDDQKALKFFEEYLKYAQTQADKDDARARIVTLQKRIKAFAAVSGNAHRPKKIPKVKSILFWTGLGIMGAGLLFQLWGYEQYRSADVLNMTYPRYIGLKHSVKWKYYAAYGFYGAGAIAVITSFFVGHDRHPLGIGLAPTRKGGVLSVYTQW